MTGLIFWVPSEIVILLLIHVSLHIFALFHYLVSWGRFIGIKHTHRDVSPPFTCWPHFFVVQTDVVIEVLLNLLHAILESSQGCWWFLAYKMNLISNE